MEYLEKTVKLVDVANLLDEQLDNGDAKESNPREKDVIIDLVMNYMNE